MRQSVLSRLSNGRIAHYYGDIVRRLFIVAGIVVLVSLPVFPDMVPTSVFLTLLVLVLLIVFAGLTNPFQRWVNRTNALIAALGMILFEYLAVVGYDPDNPMMFLVRQSLALIFFFALYFSVKTWRGLMTGQIRAGSSFERHDGEHEQEKEIEKISNKELIDKVNQEYQSYKE